MKSLMVLFAGALFATATLSAADARHSEELYRAKYGRSLPTPAHQPNLKKDAGQPAPACCLALRGHEHLAQPVATNFREDYFRAKYGRNSSTEEARLNAVTRELAAHRRTCAELGQCSQMAALTHPSHRHHAADDSACDHACCQ